MIDFPGYLSAMTFVKGCNFRCGFCHNARLLGGEPWGLIDGDVETNPYDEHLSEGFTWDELDKLCYKFKDNWIEGIVVSGGEPTIYGDKLIQLLEFLKERGLKIKLDTNGSIPEVLQKAIELLDYIAMDVKCSLERYPEITGFSKTENILKSIELLKNSKINYEIRTTIIETIHSQQEMLRIIPIIQGVKKYVMQPFAPKEDLIDEKLRHVDKTSKSYLENLYSFMSGCANEVIVR